MMVGRDVVLRVEKEPGTPGDAAPGGRRTCASIDDRGLPAVDGVTLQVRARRDRRDRGHRRQRAERADRRDHRPARPRRRRGPRLGGRDITGSRRAGRARPASATSPRTATAAASCWTSPSPRTSRCTTTAPRHALRAHVAAPDARRAPSGCCRSSTCAAASPETPARSLSGGNQQKVVIAREISGNPRGADRRAADARPGRRRDRVRPPPPARRARRGPRDAALLARARGGPGAGRPHPRDLRRADRRASCRRPRPTRSSASS